MPQRACVSCSAISETDKVFCPECGTNYDRSSANASATPEIARTKSRTVQVLAVLGLAAYLLRWLLPELFDGLLGWGETFKIMSGIEGLTQLPDSLSFVYFSNLFSALTGYIFLALVIVTSKKSS